MSDLSSPAELAELEAFISAALATHALQNPTVVGIEQVDREPPTWFVRFHGSAKEHYSAELTLGQRSLHFTSYFIPPPMENEAAFYRHLLQRNAKLYGMAFTIGDEDAVYLEGRLPNRLVTEPEVLDRLLGSLYAYTEDYFPTAVRIGFASRLR